MCGHAGAENSQLLALATYPAGSQVQHAQAHVEKIVAVVTSGINFVVAAKNRQASNSRVVAVISLHRSLLGWVGGDFKTPGGVVLKFKVASFDAIR